MRQLSRISLRDILYIMFRDKNRITLITLFAILASYSYVIVQSSIYVAQGEVLVSVGKEKLVGIESYISSSNNILFQERGQDINNALEMLKSQKLASDVLGRLRPMLQPPGPPEGFFKTIKYYVKATFSTVKGWLYEPLYWLGFKYRLSDDEKLLQALGSSLAVEALEDTTIIRVSFGWTDPEFAALAANTFADEFISKYIQVHRNLQSESFYREQTSTYQIALDNAETELSKFRVNASIANIELEKEILLKSISETGAKHRDSTLRLEENRSLKNSVAHALKDSKEWIQTPASSGNASTDLSELDRQYLALIGKRVDLANIHTAQSHEMLQIEDSIKALREQKAKNLVAFFSLNMVSKLQEVNFLKKQLDEKQKRLNLLTRKTGQLDELQRLRNIAEENYLTYSKKAEELRVSDALDRRKISGIRLITKAVPPIKPSYPRRTLIVSLAAFFGLFLGIGFSAITEYFNQTFRETQDVERILGTQLLMMIPKIEASHDKS